MSSLVPSRFTPVTGYDDNAGFNNKRHALDRVTTKIPRQYLWPSPNDFHNFHNHKAVMFVFGGWVEGESADIQKCLGLDQVNYLAAEAWKKYQAELNTTNVPSLSSYNKTYNDLGEDAYYRDPTWENCSAFFGSSNLLTRFIWMSVKSMDHMLKFIGVKITNSVENPIPQRGIATISSGYAEVINYWGNVKEHQRLYLIVKQTLEGKGPFQVIPWASADAPTASDLKYVDSKGNVRFGFSIYVGRVNRVHYPVPSNSEILAYSGLTGKSFKDSHKVAQHASLLDIIVSPDSAFS